MKKTIRGLLDLHQKLCYINDYNAVSIAVVQRIVCKYILNNALTTEHPNKESLVIDYTLYTDDNVFLDTLCETNRRIHELNSKYFTTKENMIKYFKGQFSLIDME